MLRLPQYRRVTVYASVPSEQPFHHREIVAPVKQFLPDSAKVLSAHDVAKVLTPCHGIRSVVDQVLRLPRNLVLRWLTRCAGNPDSFRQKVQRVRATGAAPAPHTGVLPEVVCAAPEPQVLHMSRSLNTCHLFSSPLFFVLFFSSLLLPPLLLSKQQLALTKRSLRLCAQTGHWHHFAQN